MLSSAKRPPQLVEVRAERRRRVDVRVREEELDIGRRFRLRRSDTRPHRLRRLLADGSGEIVVQDARPPQVALEAAETFALLLFLDAIEIDVGARIVRGG